MKFYKKRWIQSGIILISSLGIVLSVFPSFADDNIDNLKGQTSALESELDGINKDILSLSEEISATEMQVEILNGEIARTSDALVEAEENENEQYENMKSRIKYMYGQGIVFGLADPCLILPKLLHCLSVFLSEGETLRLPHQAVHLSPKSYQTYHPPSVSLCGVQAGYKDRGRLQNFSILP